MCNKNRLGTIYDKGISNLKNRMKLKLTILTLALAFFAGQSFAQDKLYKRNGDMMEVNVVEINTRTISYQKASNLDGPTYVINRDDVTKVVYENGTEEYFDRTRPGPPRPGQPINPKANNEYGNNIIGFSPLQITEYGLGVGLSYERVLDKAAVVSFYLPAAVTFTSFAPNDVFIGPGQPDVTEKPMFYIMPGLKFYPTGSKGVIRYAVGPSLVYAQGSEYNIIVDNLGNWIGADWQTLQRFGIIVNNSMNINPSEHLHLGLEMGIGVTYLNKQGDATLNPTGLFQFGFKVGYRF